MRNFDTFEIIEGQTLRRFKLLRSTATTATYLIRRPTERDFEGHCDMYVPNRVRCVCVCTRVDPSVFSQVCSSPQSYKCGMQHDT